MGKCEVLHSSSILRLACRVISAAVELSVFYIELNGSNLIYVIVIFHILNSLDTSSDNSSNA